MNAVESVRWAAARAFARAYGAVKDATGRNLPGLGRVLMQLHEPHAFTARGLRFVFDPHIATAYGRLPGGGWNEPETHLFLHHVLERTSVPARFIEVGANIGEILTSVLTGRVHSALAFEPNPRCAEAARRHLALNGLDNAEIIEQPVADGQPAVFDVNEAYPVRSSLSFSPSAPGAQPTATLDAYTQSWPAEPVIVLIDAEGAELSVMRGMADTLARLRPLIVFEFNELGRESYGVQAVRDLLGPAYSIYRLRIDGRLDERLDEAWNAVAVPADSEFATICAELKSRA